MKKMLRLLILLMLGMLMTSCGNPENQEVQTKAENLYTEKSYVIINNGTEESSHYNTLEEVQYTLEDIKTIDLSGMTLNNGDFLAKCINLEELRISESAINDIAIFQELPEIKELCITGSGRKDISFLEGTPFTETLETLALTQSPLNNNPIEDISVVSNFKNLKTLILYGNDVSDLTPLSQMNTLENLFLLDGNYNITSLKPLYGLSNIQSIMVNYSVFEKLPIEDFAYFNRWNEEYQQWINLINYD